MSKSKKKKVDDSATKELNDKTLKDLGLLSDSVEGENEIRQQEVFEGSEEQKSTNPADIFLKNNGISYTEGNREKRKLNIIGQKEIQKATETLKKYKSQKSNFDKRIIANEEWWKLKNWEMIQGKAINKEIKSNSGWLFNSIMNKLADFSDNFPEPNIRARTQGDVAEAERLKNIIPMILSRNDFENTYDDEVRSKLKNGTGMVGVFWNPKRDGIGDVEICNIDLLSIYWQPGIKDIQKSRNIFTVELVDTDLLKEAYPEFEEELQTGENITLAKYIYEDYVDTSDKSCVIDWYYKKNGKLHYCKYVNNIILFSTENEPDDYPNGLYDDGKYPFVPDTLFKMEGSIAGFGYIDVGRNPQEYIDLMDSAIMKNTLMKANSRYFGRSDSEINEDEFLDWTTPIVHTSGSLGEDALRPISVEGLDSFVFNQRDSKINELKETTANRDVSTGGTTSGVTAASAISALIETGSKGSRYAIKGTYRAFKEVIYLVIERIRQFYDLPRYVRITAEDGTEIFDTYTNQGLKVQTNQTVFGTETQYLPEFDIEVTAQKASPYAKASQNEMALQFYQFGFFNPQNTDQSLACLNMMDFDHKAEIIKQIQQNGTMYDALMQAQQQIQLQQQQIQKLMVMCDLYVPGSNLTGNAGRINQSTLSSQNDTGNPQGVQSATEPATVDSSNGSLAEQAKQKAATASQPR